MSKGLWEVKEGVVRTHGRALQGQGTACAEAMRQERAWCVRGTARRPVWLQQSEQEAEGKDRGQKGGPQGRDQDFGFL